MTPKTGKEVLKMKKSMTRKVLGYIALAMVCVMAGTVIGMNIPGAQADEQKVIVTSPFTEAIAKVRDSVVGVNNYQIVSNYGNSYSYGFGNGFGNGSYGFPWDFFNYGYGNGNGNGYGNGNGQDNSREIKYGSGSGVVIEKEYVLTNYHVIEGSHSLKVSLDDDETNLYDAKVVAYDETKDIAVLYVPGLEVEPVELGDSDALQVGDWVVNIGNAIGFTRTATAGIVSALDREIESDTTTTDRFGRKSAVTNTMIQTDAAINSGNSGGGMFNTAGELVGIPTLKYSGTRYSGAAIESIGMCIPINEAKPVIEEALKADKNAEAVSLGNSQNPAESTEGNTQTRSDRTGKPRLGILIDSNNIRFADWTNGAIPNGALVTQVEENGPAAKAGIQAGDIIVELNGKVISDGNDLMDALEGSQNGDKVILTVWRSTRVGDVSRYDFDADGDYVKNIEATLEILEEISNS